MKSELQYLDEKAIKVIQNINGISYIKKIAEETSLETEEVIFVCKNLFYIEMISFIDIFSFDNIYRANKQLLELSRIEVNSEFAHFYNINWNDEVRSVTEVYSDKSEASEEDLMGIDLFEAYVKLTNSVNVVDFLNEYDLNGVSVVLFIAFGVVKGYTRRLFAYPSNLQKERQRAGGEQDEKLPLEELKILGKISIDGSIEQFEATNNIFVINK